MRKNNSKNDSYSKKKALLQAKQNRLQKKYEDIRRLREQLERGEITDIFEPNNLEPSALPEVVAIDIVRPSTADARLMSSSPNKIRDAPPVVSPAKSPERTINLDRFLKPIAPEQIKKWEAIEGIIQLEESDNVRLVKALLYDETTFIRTRNEYHSYIATALEDARTEQAEFSSLTQRYNSMVDERIQAVWKFGYGSTAATVEIKAKKKRLKQKNPEETATIV